MDRDGFERLRDLQGKTLTVDVRFRANRNTAPLLVAENLRIENADGVEALLDITVNPRRGSTHFNVTVVGVGPICRLDVDGPPHRPLSGSHKHSLLVEACPDQNLREGVVDRSDLSGKPLRELFDMFCKMGNIDFSGTFEVPVSSHDDLRH
jgi:hypothetical protein